MKTLSRIARFLLGIFSKALGIVPLFKDVVLAIANLTRSVNVLIKGYTMIAKMVIEDREAINDLYQHINDLQAERIESQLVEQQRTASRRDDSAQIDTSWAKGDKKKLVN